MPKAPGAPRAHGALLDYYDKKMGTQAIHQAATGRLRIASSTRPALAITIVWGALVMWLSPHMPMTDLPEHAAQVALLKDLILGISPWEDILQINVFTPYLMCYGLATALSFVMPTAAAFALLTSAAFVAFVVACMALRRDMNGDPRLDWLFIPGFFGFAWQWGFISYLMAAPIGIFFILLARRYAMRPRLRSGVHLCAVGLLLFFSHGLVFLFAMAVGGLWLLAMQRPRLSPAWLRLLLPYVLLGAVVLAYHALTLQNDPSVQASQENTWGPAGRRVAGFFVYPWAAGIKQGLYAVALTLLALSTPWLLGDRLNRHARGTWIPMAVVAAIWLAVPSYAVAIALLFERFAIFILPAFALLFAPRIQPGRRRRLAAHGILVGICWAHLALLSWRTIEFADESRDADRVLQAIPPAQRILNVSTDFDSRAARNENAYIHYAAWYQTQSHGFVDFNFAYFLPQIVRFRRGSTPPIPPAFPRRPAFDWDRFEARKYDYFVLRGQQPGSQPVIDELMHNGECSIHVARQVGNWTLFRRGDCRPLRSAAATASR